MPDIEDEAGIGIEDEAGRRIEDEAGAGITKAGVLTPEGIPTRLLAMMRATAGEF